MVVGKDEETIGLAKKPDVGHYGSIEENRPQHKFFETAIEPVMFCYILAKVLSDSVVINLLEYQTCTVVLKYSPANCTEPIASNIEDEIQPVAANIVMVRNLVEAFLPSCLSLFAGPWSDLNGRKRFLLLALLGVGMTYIMWALLSMIPNLRPEFFLLASIPLSLCGGSVAIFMTLFCYISDVTTVQQRAFRMSVLNTACIAGIVVGMAGAPVLYKTAGQYSYTMVFTISSFLFFSTYLYTHFCIAESVTVDESGEKRLFVWSHIDDLFYTCFKHRGENTRTIILLIITVLVISVFIQEGESTVIYLSLREMFCWQLEDYTLYSSVGWVVTGFTSILGVWLFSSVLKLPDVPMSAFALTSRLARAVICALAPSGLYFYIGSVVGSFTTILGPLTRSQLSKIIPKNDLGKVFAFTAFLEAICPVASSPLYTFIYKATFASAPSAVYWLSAVMSAISVVILFIVMYIQWIDKKARNRSVIPYEKLDVKQK